MWQFVIALVGVLLLASIVLGQVIDQFYTSDNGSHQHSSFDEIELAIPLLRAIAASEMSESITVPKENGRAAKIVYREPQVYPLPDVLMQQLERGEPVYLETQKHVMIHLLTSQGTILVYQYDKPRPFSEHSLSLTISFYGLLVTIMVAFLTPFIRRLIKLRQAANRLGDGQLGVRLNIGTLWYLRDIELSFNHMADKINVLMDDIKLLAGGLSHELRTPLARIRMGLDTLVETDDDTQREKYEVRINRQLDEMERLLLHMLEFARLQHSLDDASPHPVCGQTLLQELVFNDVNKSMAVCAPNTDFYINAEQSYVIMALSNIIENALKYGNGQSLLAVIIEKETVAFTISDDGGGISAKQHEAIFKPFVRLSQDSTQGFGIGLAFTAKIVQRFRGSIEVDHCPKLGGARFTLRFPRVYA
ncbi:ATP-binding protein [Pseudoalteromonas sp. SMS1]|uniref:ATP-binding protein n=1 Tax=Pseudoalteromonas sp. SMS1 TaxID=2908894 RepID=UPI001F48F902|nr:ATP-binding protein [Pseudoalteromonas sp. SMS1]MCF2857806.1 ATP-binding protein [Pseudoalteromonas sp. SMS1]